MKPFYVQKLALFVLIVLASCQDDDMSLFKNDTGCSTKIGQNQYHISEEEAISNLVDFLNQTELGSRDGRTREILSIKPIVSGSVSSRTDSDSICCDTLLYVVNFQNLQGAALISADRRVREEIMAITDSGNISEMIIDASSRYVRKRQSYRDYPPNGPGFIVNPEDENEIFMNPNKLSLYDEDEEDTLIGELRDDDYDAIDDFGNSIITDSIQFSLKDLYTNVVCIDYVIDQIQNHDNHLSFNYNITWSDFFVGDVGGGGNGGNGFTNETRTNYSPWEIDDEVLPLLTPYTSWHQREPFNDLFPFVRKFILVGKSRRASAGCVPLSIAKVMAYYQYPQRYVHNNYLLDWSSLQTTPLSQTGRLSAANLLKSIADGSGSMCFYGGTFTFPHKAASFMRSVGYQSTHCYDYKFTRVRDMLDRGAPVIIYGVPGTRIDKAHCWNIDGYKVYKRTITVFQADRPIVSRTQTKEMVHCDLGWGGSCNGYYVSGIFNLRDENYEPDYDTYNDKTFNYNHYRLILYNPF